MRYEDELEGKGRQLEGAAKSNLGKLAGDRDLEARGDRERSEGKLQETIGKTKRKVGDAVKNVGEGIASSR